MPEKLQELKSLFLVESAKNNNLPIGGGRWTIAYHPEDAPATPFKKWTFRGPMERMPEFAAPNLGKFNNDVRVEAKLPEKANGVIYALGGLQEAYHSSCKTATSFTNTTYSRSNAPCLDQLSPFVLVMW